MKNRKKASFTVEAAFLVPCAATVLAVLIGYIYYMHETIYAKAAAYEAGYYALQRYEEKETEAERMQEKIALRAKEGVLGIQTTQYSVSAGSGRVCASFHGSILPDVFQDLFQYRGKAEIRVLEPVKIKRMFWLGEYLLETGG